MADSVEPTSDDILSLEIQDGASPNVSFCPDRTQHHGLAKKDTTRPDGEPEPAWSRSADSVKNQHGSDNGQQMNDYVYEGYAQFARLICCYNIRLFHHDEVLFTTNVLPLVGRGGTFFVRSGSLARPMLAWTPTHVNFDGNGHLKARASIHSERPSCVVLPRAARERAGPGRPQHPPGHEQPQLEMCESWLKDIVWGDMAGAWCDLKEVDRHCHALWAFRRIQMKCTSESVRNDKPTAVTEVKAGTTIASKHVRLDLFHDQRLVGPRFLEPFTKEILIMCNPEVEDCMNLPSLLGIGTDISPYETGGVPQAYPYLMTEMGNHGNSEEFFRMLWRRCVLPSAVHKALTSPMRHDEVSFLLGRSRAFVSTSVLRFPWALKIKMAIGIANALATLHRTGVVHGDVKLANTIVWADGNEDDPDSYAGDFLIQLCDFGSSVFLRDVPPNTETRLISHSPPWCAPESGDKIHRDLLYQTDVYSFGLVFSRIMLQGLDPFDDQFKVLAGGHARHDLAFIKRLQKEDTTVAHLMQRIHDQKIYTDSEQAVIRRVLEWTVRTSTNDRVGEMDTIVKFLQGVRVSTDDSLNM